MAHSAQSPYFVLHQLTCQFADGETLFGPLDLAFDRQRCGLVGRNGVGKTQLLRLIAGLDQPGNGHVESHAALAYVAQQPEIAADTTLAQLLGYGEAFAALARLEQGRPLADDIDRLEGRWDLHDRLQNAFAAAGLPAFDPLRSASSLSGGERMRASLCGALLGEADFLLLDEPTNHLDSAGRAWLYQQLDQWRGGLLIASHDRQLLGRMERIVELTPGALRSYGGNYEDYRRQRDTEQQAARADLEHAREERRRTRARQQKEHDMSQRRSAQTLRVVDTLNIASFERVAYKSAAKESLGTLRKQHQDRRDSLDAAVREAYQRVEEEPPVLLALPGSEVNANKQVLVLERLQLPFVSAPPLDLRIDGPMRVALTGPNGCGKSTLLKTLLGQLTALSGHCHCPLSTAYLDQTLSQLDPGLSVMEHLGLQDSPLAEGALRTRLAQLQLGADRIALPLGSLSGGERLKAALACALWRRQPAQLLLLDEPTNHLDLASSLAIETALADFPGAMLVVSHDEDFLQALRPTHRLNRQADGWRLQAW
ncbi:ABC-F family ATP-binding cassette domain-containing protein [Serratia marcescens]|jgi:ATPase subunit of ABC transporter with duplicated ATPase domains|uniref:ABC-F family ATP-binding cassette domain-containing protein n=1 Tax=Serratia marcescens TaxID=615 RepID=UPI001BD42B5C|nr:ABC-F family ATP-binding cassette domain-containing protein [Serratia marcescens]MDV5745472.1 ABC-F family ATP-binding cassette domain-containing protein [Serratia marcescens]MDV5750383.1 ABC-F family ATP-binding cassette domain-containing protein [Serratia marcescens]MDV5781821.1 ABC-F family ATP-binding cassette domain-containing protein [Serratia marcescens]MDV5786763.1 ABC-F family ATP-binding cassette domain-containing protein [Serratia marcescens]MDV5833661.1 ABC-F family ATP-binding 